MKLFSIILALVLFSSFANAADMPLSDYEAVAAGQTDQVMGPIGGAGDILQYVVVSVATAATSTSSIKDGSGSSITLTAANTPIGVYTILLGARSTSGAWKITTGAGATVLAVGRFK